MYFLLRTPTSGTATASTGVRYFGGYMMRQQSTTVKPIVFPMFLAGSSTLATGVTCSVSISKNGGAFGAASGAVTELSGGWYSWAGNATDRNTLGELAIDISATGCDNMLLSCLIVGFDPFQSVLTETLSSAAVTVDTAIGGSYSATTSAVYGNARLVRAVTPSLPLHTDTHGGTRLSWDAMNEITVLLKKRLGL